MIWGSLPITVPGTLWVHVLEGPVGQSRVVVFKRSRFCLMRSSRNPRLREMVGRRVLPSDGCGGCFVLCLSVCVCLCVCVRARVGAVL